MIDERELLRRVGSLDEEAVSAVFDTYYQPLYRYIYHHVHHQVVAEDLAGEVFTRMLAQIAKKRGPRRNLRAWLYRVAANLVIDEARRFAHRDHESLDGILADTLQDGGDSLENLARSAIAAERVRHALLDLTEEQRQIVVLKFLEGMSNSEVAEITGKTVGAVKALQHRGIEALRVQLDVSQESVPARWRGQRAAVPSLGG